MAQSPISLSAADINRNIGTIMDVPRSVLPDGAARVQLVALARNGYDVYAYQSGGTNGTWNAWLGPLADATADHNGRVSLEDWLTQYAALTHFMLNAREARQNGGAA